MTEGTLKRKKPPTFQHLPLQRAKKLKQTWVENAKIKSKWKAQKRKEGLLPPPAPVQNDEEESEGESSDAEQSDEASKSDAEEITKQESELEEKPAPKKSMLHPSRAHIHPELAEKKPHIRRRPDEKAQPTPENPPSLRDLTREAYGRSSLHTFKVGRGRGTGARGGARGRGRGRGRGDGRGPAGETGRGQPNMKLRMTAMLEKIKQDYA
ncbi:hypothetical protein Hypma_008717 [Hypsizygus marmoreus]|uniref:rRNA-processing protein FYV7 n=1 Tax=Hypsizygus marmoreus TaxID=39966 RepID=A0A369JXX2_HYPMA|nr:hypothetical protein Hypma_008717 [Hypsizygus marmoreus]